MRPIRALRYYFIVLQQELNLLVSFLFRYRIYILTRLSEWGRTAPNDGDSRPLLPLSIITNAQVHHRHDHDDDQ